jgi:hemerythrin-like domain-containing protein
MILLDELHAEHEVIERVAGALLTYANEPGAGRSAEDGAAFLRFFRLYAGHFHHAREEDILFAALRDRAGLPADRGPIATMIADHGRMADLLNEVEAGLGTGAVGAARLPESAAAYVHALWHHIDAENSVLFPECGPRLRRNGVTELPSRPMAPDEREALSAGRALHGTRRHPTLEDRVTVYAGATIMGGDTVVGAGSTIGAGVFLNRSVPASSLVLNEEARIIVLQKRSDLADYQI